MTHITHSVNVQVCVRGPEHVDRSSVLAAHVQIPQGWQVPGSSIYMNVCSFFLCPLFIKAFFLRKNLATWLNLDASLSIGASTKRPST